MPSTRFYQRDRDDKHNTINRCFVDAEQGRTKLALERILDLLEEFPGDASVLYAQGLLLRDHLGSGLEAVAMFERAFHAAKPGEEVRGLAACNVAALARGQAEFDKWSATAREILPDDPGLKALCDFMAEAKQAGADYHAVVADHTAATAAAQGDRAGGIAARLEIALTGGSFRLADEVHLRTHRAKHLRNLDAMAAHTREMLVESFTPAERLALHQALAEIERAIALDEFDAELWNFRSAWCSLLRRDEEAIAFAEKAIALRPHRYAKPWINKANALWHLKRAHQARECAREAVRQAEAIGDSQDRELAGQLASFSGTGHETPDESQFAAWVDKFLTGASLTSKKEVSQKGWSGNYDELVKGFLNRTRLFGNEWNALYIRIVAEMLIYFSPETAWAILAAVQTRNFPAYDHAVNSIPYIITRASGVLQRDAVRLLCLLFLGPLNLAQSRLMYRQAVMETAEASPAFKNLPEIVRAELERNNPWLIHFIASQDPVDDAGRARASRNILWRFDSAHLNKKGIQSTPPTGCLVLVALFCVTSVIVALWKYRPSITQQLSAQSEHVSAIATIAAIVLAFLGTIAMMVQRARRKHLCARCGRWFQKVQSAEFPFRRLPGVTISANALRSGTEGIGRCCAACGRTYCSSCEEPGMQCECGQRQLSMVRLSYRANQ